MTDTAQIFKALADETRLSILSLLLKKGETCVCRFEDQLGISQSKASRHLRYLLHSGLVTSRRDGIWIHYRIPASPGAKQAKILRTLRSLIG